MISRDPHLNRVPASIISLDSSDVQENNSNTRDFMDSYTYLQQSKNEIIIFVSSEKLKLKL